MEWKTIPLQSENSYNIYHIRSYVPMDRPFLALWKGAFSICEFDEEDQAFWICFLPAQIGEWKLALDRENKITHWCEFQYPNDY